MLDEHLINAVYERRGRALSRVADALTGAVRAKAELETLAVYYTNEGLEGTNDKVRAAYLAARTEPEREAVADAEAALRGAQLELDLADNDLDRLRSLLQFLNVSPSDR